LPWDATEDEEAKWLSASNEGDASAKIMAEKSLKSLIPGDIDRPQHKEFVGKIDEVLRNFDEKILSLDHDLVINRTAEKKNTYDRSEERRVGKEYRSERQETRQEKERN